MLGTATDCFPLDLSDAKCPSYSLIPMVLSGLGSQVFLLVTYSSHFKLLLATLTLTQPVLPIWAAASHSLELQPLPRVLWVQFSGVTF